MATSSATAALTILICWKRRPLELGRLIRCTLHSTVIQEVKADFSSSGALETSMPSSVVTIASEPVSIDYDRSFEKNRDVDVDSMLHGHVD